MGSARKARTILISDPYGPIEVQLSYRRSRSTVLRVGQTGTVRMGVPYGMPDLDIEELLIGKAGWIRKSMARIEALRGRLDPLTEGAGVPSSIDLLGVSVHVVAIKSDRKGCLLEGGSLRVYAKDPEDAEAVRKQMDAWYKGIALDLAKACVDMYWAGFAAMGYNRPALRVRAMHTRWGSYNKRTNSISLNAALVKAPREHMEYVVAHELAHLIHLDHSRGFCEVLSGIMPDWKQRRSRLRAWATAGA